MGEEDVPSVVELPIFQVQKKKFWSASIDARATCFKPAIVAGEYACQWNQQDKCAMESRGKSRSSAQYSGHTRFGHGG